MQLHGSGIDIVSIERIRRLVEQYGSRFIERILHESEQREVSQISNRDAFVARRFAAKEAASKALGVGIGRELHFTDMQVTHDSVGKPALKFSEECRQRLNLYDKQTLLTISDERHYAVAHVILYSSG